MNLIKIDNKMFTVIEGGLSVSNESIEVTIKKENYTVKSLEDFLSSISDTIQILDVASGNEAIASYTGYTHLKSIKKNIDNNTYTIVIEESTLLDRIKELEQTIDELMYTELTDNKNESE